MAGRDSGKRPIRRTAPRKSRPAGRRRTTGRKRPLQRLVRKAASPKKRPIPKPVRKTSGAKKQTLKKPARKPAGAQKQLPKKPIRRTTSAEKKDRQKTALKKVATKRRRRVPRAVSQPKKTSSPPRKADRASHRFDTKIPHLDRVRRILQDPEPLPPAAPTPSAGRLFADHAPPDETPQTTPAADSEASARQDAITGGSEPEEPGPASTPSGDSQPAADGYESLRLRWEQEPPEDKD